MVWLHKTRSFRKKQRSRTDNPKHNETAASSDGISSDHVQTTVCQSREECPVNAPSTTQPGAFPVAGIGSNVDSDPRLQADSVESPPPPLLEATLVSDAPVADIVEQQNHDQRRRRNRIVLGILVVICTVLGVTLGFVLGKNQNDTPNNKGKPQEETPTAEPTLQTTESESPQDETLSSSRLEVKSNMAETGHVNSASKKRAFAVTWHLPGEASTEGTTRNTKQQFPLVLFSSGAGAKVKDYESFLKGIATEGYIIAAMEHTYLDESVLIDGADKLVNWIAVGAFAAFPHQNGPKEHLVRARDVKCLLDLLDPSKEQEEEEPLCDRSLSSISDSTIDFDLIRELIDFERVGYVGHSAGGTAAQAMISVSSHPNHEAFPRLSNPSRDDRIAAAINYDGCYFLDWARMGRITKPFLFFASDISGFWTDNYNLNYTVTGDSIIPDYEGCIPDPDNDEACARDYGGPLNVPNPFWNKRKIIESRVACRQDGYATRLKNSRHNSFNVENQVGTPEYNKSIEITMEFLDKYLKHDTSQNTTAILAEMEPQVGTIYSNEAVDQSICGSSSLSPDADQDQDALSNSDEIVLFSTSPERQDTDGDLVCDGKEAILFENPAIWDNYENPDTTCFDN